MITFFRKIRQSLLPGNKFSRYLFYATGEIVLVVVGILIALALNNRKEQRAVAQSEYLYMVNLKEDLQADLDLYEAYFVRNRELYQLIDSLIVQLSAENYRSTSDATAYQARIMTTKWNRVRPVERTFEQMKSSGQLKIISNHRVSDGISDYYNSIFELETYNEALVLWLEHYISLMGRVYDGKVLFEILKTRQKVFVANTAIITDDRKDINELITSLQYIYGAIKLSEDLVVQRREKAGKLIREIGEHYPEHQ